MSTNDSYGDRIDKMYTDLYIGDGPNNPSITARMFLVEESIERFGKNSSKIVWLLLAILGTILTDLLTHAIKL